MGEVLSYFQEMCKAMNLLSLEPKVIFLGQSVLYPGPVAISETLKDIPAGRRIEMPVAEDLQLGISIGLALQGFVPVSIFPRVDFLIVAANQLVNHLDKIEAMSGGSFMPKVIIRTSVGASHPLDPGPQHRQDHSEALKLLLTNIDVVRLDEPGLVMPSYMKALKSPRSTILIEIGEKMRVE